MISRLWQNIAIRKHEKIMKKYLFFCFIWLSNSFCQEKKEPTNPFVQTKRTDSTISFKNGAFITEAFDTCKNISFTEKNSAALVAKMRLAYTWIYYIDRGAVQQAKKNDNIRVFNLIKKRSNDLKEKLQRNRFLFNNNPYKKLYAQINTVNNNISAPTVIEELSSLPNAQEYVVPWLQDIVVAKKAELEAELNEAIKKKETQLAELEKQFNAEKKQKEMVTTSPANELSTKKLEAERIKNTLIQEKESLEKEMVQQKKQMTENADLIKKIEAEILATKQDLNLYDELDMQTKKIAILEAIKNLFDTMVPVANSYYDEYEQWKKQSAEESFFRYFATFITEQPKILKEKSEIFSKAVKDALEELKTNIAKQGLDVSIAKGGFTLLQQIADGSDMLDKQKFNDIVQKIEADIQSYKATLSKKSFSTTKQTVEEKQKEIEQLKSISTEIKSKIASLQASIDQKERAILSQTTEINKLFFNIVNQDFADQQKLKDTEKLFEEKKQKILEEYNEIKKQAATKRTDLYKTINYKEVVNQYINQLQSLLCVKQNELVYSITLDSALLDLLPLVEPTITINSLNFLQKTDETLRQKAIHIKQSITESIATWYAQLQKKAFNTNTNEPKEQTDSAVYFAVDQTFLKILENKGTEWQERIKEINTMITKMVQIIHNDDNFIAAFNEVNTLYIACIKPIYTMLEQVNITITKVYALKEPLSIKNMHAACKQIIDEKLQQTSKHTGAENQLAQVKTKDAAQLAHAFFTTVATALKQDINSVSIPLSDQINNESFFIFINTINKYSKILSIIEQTQLTWYTNAPDLIKLFDPVKQIIQEKKGSFLSQAADNITKANEQEQSNTILDFTLADGLLDGKVVQEIKKIHAIQEWAIWTKILFSANERAQAYKKAQPPRWAEKGKSFFHVYEGKRKIFEGNYTLFGQTVFPLYEQTAKQLKQVGFDQVKTSTQKVATPKKELLPKDQSTKNQPSTSYNPFASDGN